MKKGVSDPQPLFTVPSKKIPEAKIYAEWISILRDLRMVHSTLISMLEMFKSDCEKKLCNMHLNAELIRRDLYISAVVTYARCFASGTRKVIKKNEVFKESDGSLKFHNFIMKLRNSHFSHALNILEETKIGLYLSLEKLVLGVGHFGINFTNNKAEDVVQFKNLTEVAINFSIKKVEEYRIIVLNKANNLSGKELEQLTPLTIKVKGLVE